MWSQICHSGGSRGVRGLNPPQIVFFLLVSLKSPTDLDPPPCTWHLVANIKDISEPYKGEEPVVIYLCILNCAFKAEPDYSLYVDKDNCHDLVSCTL